MIERQTIDGQGVTVAYFDRDFNPCDKQDAPCAKLSFDDGRILFLTEAVGKKFNPNHDDRGRFASGDGGGDGGGSGGSSGGGHIATASLYSAPTKSAADLIAETPGAADYVAHIEGKLAGSIPTNAPVALGGHVMPNGEYSPERQAVHVEIMKKIFSADKIAAAMPKTGEKPTLSVLGGRGGSGKSFITGPNGPVSKTNSLLLDSDSIKEMLPGYEGWNAALFHDEASTVLDKADAYATRLGINVTHDATLKSLASSTVRQEAYRQAGYKVNGYFVHAQPEVAVKRALGRAMKPGGRYVPPHVILGNTENEKNFDSLRAGYANWHVYDNNGTGPRLVAQGHNL
jgi:predicted ABC-type ATPase